MPRALAVLTLVLSTLATAEPATVPFTLDQPFTLAFGDTGTGPGGLTIWFSGSGPHFTVKVNDVEREPTWAKSPAKSPTLRGLLDDLFITVEAMPDSERARLRVTKAKLGALAWSKPFELHWCEFVTDPDGGRWFIEQVDEWKGEATVRVRRAGPSSESFSLVLQKGRALGRDGDFVVSAELATPPATAAGVRLTVRKPRAESKPLALGKPVTLIPDESAVGEGLTLTLRGYGHKITRNDGDLAFTEIDVKAGGEETSLRFMREQSPAPRRWHGYEVRMTACEDQGPPHSSTASSTFVVVKAPAGSGDDD